MLSSVVTRFKTPPSRSNALISRYRGFHTAWPETGIALTGRYRDLRTAWPETGNALIR